MPALSGVALIRDDEADTLKLPNGWGTWGEAEQLVVEDDKCLGGRPFASRR